MILDDSPLKPTKFMYLSVSSTTSIPIIVRVMRKNMFFELHVSTNKRLIQKLDMSNSMMRGSQCCIVAWEAKVISGLDTVYVSFLPPEPDYLRALTSVWPYHTVFWDPMLGLPLGAHNFLMDPHPCQLWLCWLHLYWLAASLFAHFFAILRTTYRLYLIGDGWAFICSSTRGLKHSSVQCPRSLWNLQKSICS